MSSLSTTEASQAASGRRKKRLTAFLFVVPLLIFILLTFRELSEYINFIPYESARQFDVKTALTNCQ